MRRFSWMVVAALALSPSWLAGQSLLAMRGLGTPVEPLDARARALGSVGIGLRGSVLLPSDPAAAAGLPFPTLEITLQPQWGEGELAGETVHSQGTRFPLLSLGYPVSGVGGTVTLTLGSFLDQRWEMRRGGTADLEGAPTPITDVFRSDGGVAVVRVGWAQPLGEKLALAVGMGRYTGSVSRIFTRTFDSLSAGSQVLPYRDGGQWGYSGTTASLGLRWFAADFLHIAGLASWSSDLRARPTKETEGDAAAFALPLEVKLGASGVLTSALDLTLGVSYADAQPLEEGAGEAAAGGGAWSVGGGLEWRGLTRGERACPVRVGLRRSDLPWAGGEASATETLASAGLGLELFRAADVVVGGLDLALERGSRDAGSLSESFWRGTLTIRVAGF